MTCQGRKGQGVKTARPERYAGGGEVTLGVRSYPMIHVFSALPFARYPGLSTPQRPSTPGLLFLLGSRLSNCLLCQSNLLLSPLDSTNPSCLCRAIAECLCFYCTQPCFTDTGLCWCSPVLEWTAWSLKLNRPEFAFYIFLLVATSPWITIVLKINL